MAAYLLGTQALVDASRNDTTNPVRRWSSGDDALLEDIFVSAASFLVFRKQLESLETVQRSNWQDLFDRALNRYERAGRIVPVSPRIAVRAGVLATTTLRSFECKTLGDAGLMVVATALYEQFTLVEQRRQYHHVLEDMERLTLVDPYE